MISWRAHCIAVVSSLLVGSAASGAPGLDLYVSCQGSGQGVGSRDDPFAALTAARDAIRGIRQERGGQLPKGGITVWIRGGAYHFDRPLVLTAEDAGTEQAPIVYRAHPGEEVVFDGSNAIDPGGFEIVVYQPTLDRLASAARGNVVARRIDDPVVAKALASGATLSIDGKMMQYARFPNVGFAHVRKILHNGAVYPHGRTKGKPPSYSMENPIVGLLVDEYRKSAPDRRAYRVAVMSHFAKRPSFDPDAKYDPATVNGLLYLNTGKLLLGH